MKSFPDWISANKELLFSGVFAAVIAVLLGWMLKDKPPSDAGIDLAVKVLTSGLQGKMGEVADLEQQVRKLEEAINALKAQQSPGIAEALAELATGETEKAEAIFRRVLETNIKEGEKANKQAAAAARHIGALAYLNDTGKAIAAYHQAVNLDPDDPDGWNQLGHLLGRIGDLDGAIKAYEKGLALSNRGQDKSVIAARYLGALAYLHDTDKAIAAYRQSVNLDPGDPDGWNRLGHLLRRISDLDGAIKAYEKVLAMGNRVRDKFVIATALGNLGLIYRTRGELDKAEEFHLSALAYLHGIGKALAAYRQTVNLNPDNPDGWGQLGRLLEQIGELDGALKAYERALALGNRVQDKFVIATALGNLGLIYGIRGELDKAEEFLLRALELHKELGGKPGMASAYGRMGAIAVVRGDQSKACEYWAKSKALYEEVGIPRMVKWVAVLMAEAECSPPE